jgi:hypothetical protein
MKVIADKGNSTLNYSFLYSLSSRKYDNNLKGKKNKERKRGKKW